MPRVSVFIPSYNHVSYVEAAVRSVLDQTYQDFEIVVTDDGSTDGTADRVAAIADARIVLKRFAKNRGAVVAVNDALGRCAGEYLALLNSDDVFLPSKLERQVDFLDANPDVGAVFTFPSFIDHAGHPVHQDQALNGHLFDVENRSQAAWLHHFFFHGNCLCHPSILIRADCYRKLGAYDPRYAALPDFHMWIRLVSAYKIHVMPERLIAFRHLPNGENMSSTRVDNYLRFTWENPRVLRLYADLPAALFQEVFARELALVGLSPQQDQRVALARICMATGNPTLHRLGLDLMFEAMRAEYDGLQQGITPAELHREVGRRDIYNIVAVNRTGQLERELREAKSALLDVKPSIGPAQRPAGIVGTPDVAILDDLFPQVISAFRFEEYRYYLDQLPGAQVFTTGAAFHFVKERRPVEAVISEYEADFPSHAGRVQPLRPMQFPKARHYYTIFLNNIFEHVAKIEEQGGRFSFTLYPGGGLALGQSHSDAKLARVLGSRAFSKVVVTQPIIETYLLQKKLCRADQIVPIFGGVLPRDALLAPPEKLRFPIDKPVFDLCFVANLYMPQGLDKGYDLFVQTAQALLEGGVQVRCHVVGPYDAATIPLGVHADHFRFYGLQPTSFFRGFYAQMDVILSPNRPFVLAPGAFDGFPTACCAEAGLQEVVVLCTDELDLNRDLKDGVDICIVRPDVNDIVTRLAHLLTEPGRLVEMGRSGRQKMLGMYDPSRQLAPRLELLRGV